MWFLIFVFVVAVLYVASRVQMVRDALSHVFGSKTTDVVMTAEKKVEDAAKSAAVSVSDKVSGG